jgi:hypothetical protein
MDLIQCFSTGFDGSAKINQRIMGKYQIKRKTDIDELERRAVKYDLATSFDELEKMFEAALFKFENHLLLCEKEGKPVKTLQAIQRNLERQVGQLKNVSP